MRTWIYRSLIAVEWEGIQLADNSERISQTSRMTEISEFPYLYYREGTRRGELHTIETPAITTPFQVFAHDRPGDYLRLDSMMARLRTLFTMNPPVVPDERFISSTWLEVSGDVPQDPQTGSISKFIRCQVVHTP